MNKERHSDYKLLAEAYSQVNNMESAVWEVEDYIEQYNTKKADRTWQDPTKSKSFMVQIQHIAQKYGVDPNELYKQFVEVDEGDIMETESFDNVTHQQGMGNEQIRKLNDCLKIPGMKDLGWVNSWARIPEIVKYCNDHNHKRVGGTKGHKFSGITITCCPLCKFFYQTDAGD